MICPISQIDCPDRDCGHYQGCKKLRPLKSPIVAVEDIPADQVSEVEVRRVVSGLLSAGLDGPQLASELCLRFSIVRKRT